MSIADAIAEAAQYWFGDRFAVVETMEARAPECKDDQPNNSVEAAARAFSQASLPDALRHEFEDIARQTVHRLRNVLYQGKQLKAYYFGGLLGNDRQAVSREFWATPAADGVLEAGTLWPFGRPNAWYERRPSYPLFLIRLELDALLSEQPVKKPGLPAGKMRNLIAALRTLDGLPNREKQREVLRKLPEFEQYHLTDEVLREAEKQVPRKPGRKPLRSEQ
jgi:hypothetical protein